jgi:1,2-dihydroxy-3-keto-5-methylthiopentene dioxygenase
MATLKLEDGTTYTSVDDTARELAPLNVQLKPWLIGDNPDTEKHFCQAADLETN